MGNLHSVAKAVEQVSTATVCITQDKNRIRQAHRVIFPGQGAARDCMARINDQQLGEVIVEAARSKPFLGICMGLQVLMRYSEENEGTSLLGVIPGQVLRFPKGEDKNGQRLKVPHMGWNQVNQSTPHPLWTDIVDNSRFYFVHSYYVQPDDERIQSASSEHGVLFTSAIAKDNVFAVQFHPEKSAGAGLQLLKNFIQWDI